MPWDALGESRYKSHCASICETERQPNLVPCTLKRPSPLFSFSSQDFFESQENLFSPYLARLKSSQSLGSPSRSHHELVPTRKQTPGNY